MSIGLVVVLAIIVLAIFTEVNRRNRRESGSTMSIGGYPPRPFTYSYPEESSASSSSVKPEEKQFLRRGVDGKLHPVSDVREGFFSNGSAHVTNERGNPQRVSRRCLRCL